MAHTVDFEIPPRNLGNVDVKFKPSQDGTLIGTLTLSKGGVDWKAHKVSVNRKSWSWSAFARLLDYGKVERANSAGSKKSGKKKTRKNR